jgi:hypothetical protein
MGVRQFEAAIAMTGFVMAGPDPAIHVFLAAIPLKTSPGMTS